MDSIKEPKLHLQFNELIEENGVMWAHDETTHRHHAIVHNEASIMPSDSFGSCLGFDGVNAYLELDNRLQYQPGTTIAFWADPADFVKEQCFLGKMDIQGRTQFWFGCVENQFQIRYGLEIKTLRQGTPDIEKWLHLAVVLEEQMEQFSVSVYLNGQHLETVLFDAILPLADGQAWQIGHLNSDEKDYFRGQIDDVLFYHSALEASALLQVMDLARTAQSKFSQINPISFELISDGVRNVLYITQKEEGTTQPLSLVVTNTGKSTITFPPFKRDRVQHQGHLELRFRPQTFDEMEAAPQETETGQKDVVVTAGMKIPGSEFIRAADLPDGWDAGKSTVNPDQTLSIPLYYTGEDEFALSPAESVSLELEYSSANGAGGGKSTQVILNYQSIMYQTSRAPVEGSKTRQVDITKLYLHYENIAGYWDGDFVLALEKTPIVHQSFDTEKCGSIGLKPDGQYRLAVGGNLKLEADHDYDTVVQITDKSGDQNYLNIDKSGKDDVGEALNVAGNISTTGKLQENGHDLLPSGAIIMWSGNVSSIPMGWVLCDGKDVRCRNGEDRSTPDLKGRFIVGIGNGYSAGETGGHKEVKLTESQMPGHSHSHNFSISSAGSHRHNKEFCVYGNDGGGRGNHNLTIKSKDHKSTHSTDYAGDHSHSLSGEIRSVGGGQPHENRPPYYALCFIMKT